MTIGGSVSKIAVNFRICLMATDIIIVCSTITGTATADAFNNSVSFPGVVSFGSPRWCARTLLRSLWESGWVFLTPFVCPPPPGWCLCVVCLVCVCVLGVRPSRLCSASVPAGLTWNAWPHTCLASHATACHARTCCKHLLKPTRTYVAQLARFCMHFLDPARRIICSACSQALRYGIHSF